MNRHFSAVPWSRREARFAAAAVALIVFCGLLFAFPGPQPFISAEFQLRGLGREQGVSVIVSEEQGVGPEWASEDEALLSGSTPRKSAARLPSGQQVVAFTTHETIVEGKRERPAS